MIVPHNLYLFNRLPGKQDTQLRCSAWNKKLSHAQIQYAAMDAVAGCLIDYVIHATPSPTRYSHLSMPVLETHVGYVCGINEPHEPAIVGIWGTVVDTSTPIVSGPHFEPLYKVSVSAQQRLVKVRVTATTQALCTLPHPRSSFLCSRVSVGDVLWLPHKKLRPSDAPETDQTSAVSNMFGHQEHTHHDADSDSDVQSLTSTDDNVASSKLIPSGEAEAHIEDVWVSLKERLHGLDIASDGPSTCSAGRRVQGNFFLSFLVLSCHLLSCLLSSCLVLCVR